MFSTQWISYPEWHIRFFFSVCVCVFVFRINDDDLCKLFFLLLINICVNSLSLFSFFLVCSLISISRSIIILENHYHQWWIEIGQITGGAKMKMKNDLRIVIVYSEVFIRYFSLLLWLFWESYNTFLPDFFLFGFYD